jgi:hypothetical protein
MNTMGDVYKEMHKILYVLTPAIQDFLLHACIGVVKDECILVTTADKKQESDYINDNNLVTRKSLGK